MAQAKQCWSPASISLGKKELSPKFLATFLGKSSFYACKVTQELTSGGLLLKVLLPTHFHALWVPSITDLSATISITTLTAAPTSLVPRLTQPPSLTHVPSL
jgi:hypothetical protein